MIPAVSPETGLRAIPKEAEKLHFTRPLPKKTLASILKKCTGLRQASMSRSTMQRIPKKSRKLLEENGVSLEVEKRQGRAISMPLEKMQHALEMRKDFQSLREVERVTGISKSTVHYLERYAKRAKVKSGKNVIYLK